MNNSKLLWFITTLLNTRMSDPVQKLYNFLYVWALSPTQTFRSVCTFLNYDARDIKSIFKFLFNTFPNLYIGIAYKGPIRTFLRLVNTPITQIEDATLREFVVSYNANLFKITSGWITPATKQQKKKLNIEYFNKFKKLDITSIQNIKGIVGMSVTDIIDISLSEVLDILNPNVFKVEHEDLVNQALFYFGLIYKDNIHVELISKILLKALSVEDLEKLIFLMKNYYDRPLLDENNNIFLLED